MKYSKLTQVEINMAKIAVDLENTKNTVKELKEDIKKLATKEDLNEIKVAVNSFIEKADEKYASKLTEKIVYAMAGIILTAVLGAIMGLVIIK